MPALKPGLHPRNRYNGRHDLATLCQVMPELTQSLILTPGGEQSVDFANPQAVKAFDKALLVHFYAVKNWDILDGFLCLPAPGRADYIRRLADLLSETSGTIPVNVSVLDVEVGVNCICPLIGVHEYGWRFTDSETDSEVLNSAQTIVNANPGLTRAIRLRRQRDVTAIFSGTIHKNEQYETTSCNPPLHDSAASVRVGSERKHRNLGRDKGNALNFDGRRQELWHEDGEVAFIKKMIAEGQAFGRQVAWLTTLVSRGENLSPLYHALTDASAVKAVKKEMAQGQKQSCFIAWTFMDNDRRRRFMACKR